MIDSSELPSVPLVQSEHSISMIPKLTPIHLMSIAEFTRQSGLYISEIWQRANCGELVIVFDGQKQFVDISKAKAKQFLPRNR